MATRSGNAPLTSLPVPTRPTGITPVESVGQIAPVSHATEIVAPTRFATLIPAKPTQREKAVGREVAYRVAVQEGHLRLQQAAVVAIGAMHEHTHREVVAGVCAMNRRVRAIADPDDRAEIAEITAEQKAMYVRHQFGVLEAGCYRVAAEVDRPLYAERRRGLLGRLLGD